jgi:hypothetical protein
MHTKARFHRAKALIQLGALDAARTDIGKLEGAEREARISAAEMQLLQELLAKAVRAPQVESRVLELDDLGDLLHHLQTARGREKWGFLSEDPDTIDTVLGDVGLGCPDEEVGRLFWEACVLLPVDQQLVLLKALRTDSWGAENWENLLPFLKEVCEGWNELCRDTLCTELFQAWEHELVEWPALLVSAANCAQDARHRRWKELYERELQLIAAAAPTWNKTAPHAPPPSKQVSSIPEVSQPAIMLHAMLSAHGKSELVAQVESMVTESPYFYFGASLLHTMTLAGKDGIVSFLLQRGADPNCQDNGRL